MMDDYLVSIDIPAPLRAITSITLHLASLACAWSVATCLFKTLPSRFIRLFFVKPLRHPVPQRPWTYRDQSPSCALHVFTERQVRIRVPAAQQDKEPSPRTRTHPPCPTAALDENVLNFGVCFSMLFIVFLFTIFSVCRFLSCLWSTRL